jgi:predicted  nucleic acid-binding Zn-ribbon protein
MDTSIRPCCSQTKNIDKKIHILKNKIEIVHNKIQHLNDEVVRLGNLLQCLSKECSSLKMNCQQQSTVINELKSSQDMSEQGLLEIKQKMEDLHYVSCDGSLMWKIDEFKQKFCK